MSPANLSERKKRKRTSMYSILNRPKRSISLSLSQKTVKKIPMDVYRISIIILKRYLDLLDYFLISPPLM